MHCHFRDYSWEVWQREVLVTGTADAFGGDPDDRLPMVAGYTARQFARAIAMPNTQVPIKNARMATGYRDRILHALSRQGIENFEPLMTIYITPGTSRETILEARQAGVVAGKFYPKHGTTGSGDGIPNFGKPMYEVYDAMQECGMLALFHGANPDPNVDIFDKEYAFIPVAREIRERFPQLTMVFEHMSTGDAVDFVLKHDNTFGTITPQHLQWTRNQLLGSGLNPAAYCMPPLQTNEDREALVAAAVSGSPKFFAGTDSAPHYGHRKYCEGGCMGCFTASYAVELYAEVFEEHGGEDWVEKLERFLSEFGAAAYGLPLNEGTLMLERSRWRVSVRIPREDDAQERYVVPFRPGEVLGFRAWREK